LPNGLSMLRIAAVPIIMALLLTPWQGAYMAALAVFAIASISDTLDGYMARRQKLVSNLGIFLDLTADKLLISAILITMVELSLLPAWLVVVIVGREFIVTGIRTFAAAEGVVIPAGPWGKRKTVITIVAVAALIVYGDMIRGGWAASIVSGNFVGQVLHYSIWLMYLAALLTVTSGVQYLINVVPLLRQKEPTSNPNWHE
jgi:CDP-diacylglycerol---glycerol-3-phosphate 3-phosphatidyltransferase